MKSMKIRLSPVLQKELKKQGVGVVYLMGSRALGVARKDSDVDFGIVMKEKKRLKNESKLHSALYKLLSSCLSPKDKAKDIDVIFLDTAPLYYAISARDEGKVLFEISSQLRANFEERATMDYADFEPFRREQEKVTLAMIG